MKLFCRFLIPFILAAVLIGCDATEDPLLLNPEPPDSTRVRVVNLLPEGEVDVAAAGILFAQGVPPGRISTVKPVLILEQTSVVVRRSAPVVRFDTVFSQTLAPASRVTYMVLGTRDTMRILSLGTGTQEETDLNTLGEAKISFINAIDDSAGYFIKSGCQSGPVLFGTSPFADAPRAITTKSRDLSVYLFSSRDSVLIASARLTPQIGTVSFIIAARINGRVGLYRMGTNESNEPLMEYPQETRTTAKVELLNALPNAQAISAEIEDGSQIATGVPMLTISQGRDVDACVDPFGDTLLVSTTGGQIRTPITLSVGSRSLVVVYNKPDSGTRALVLSRDILDPSGGKVHIRGVNVADTEPLASISIGAGAPQDVNPDSRPFGTLPLGIASGYVSRPAGKYPFMLSSASTGRFYGGGIEDLEAGYYTLFVVNDAGTPSLRIVRDDIENEPIRILRSTGVRSTFFNLMTDAEATFTAGQLTLPPLAYSYVYSTVIPFDITSISSNAGQVDVTPSLGGYTIGTTGSGSSRRIIAFRAPMEVLPPKAASIRFLNAIADASDLVMRIGTNETAPTSTLTFGQPTAAVQLEARKYSFFVTRDQDTTVLARADGVELLAGRHYLLVVAPKRQGNISPLAYESFWIQE